ncbi:acyltransferase [bacterium]|nr:acyltransferase [bacterium]
MIDQQTYKFNNFDLLRLIAAFQVVIHHTLEILRVNPPEAIKGILHFSHLFPGVPIFFFISGFLISKSYESNSKLSEYSQNRVLRLYPGLIACVSLSFLFIYISGYMATTNAGVMDWGILYLAKTTFVQFYNPDFMRAYGDGVLNGSLWTITVELQFYFLVPIIYLIFKLQGSGPYNFKLIMLIVIFLLINRVFTYIPAEYHGDIAYKLFRVSFLPWFYMFLFGVFIQKNFDVFHKIIAGRFIPFFILYCVIGYFCLTYKIELGNNINPLVYIFLVIVALSFAYSFVGLSKRLLKGNDISYGTYIYHMPVVNFMLYNGYSGDIVKALYVFLATIVLALISWVVIEKRSLRLKRHPLNPLNRS